MKILMITENDPAGVAITFCNAINRYTSHSCRLITKEIRYNFMFEKDLHLPFLNEEGYEEIVKLLKESDILYFHMLSDENVTLGPINVKEYSDGKKIVHHHHGHPDFRSNPDKYRKKYIGTNRTVIVSTPDLLKLIPEALWVPNPVPLFDELFMPEQLPDEDKILLCQSPTRKDLKNTEEFIRVAEEICAEFSNVSYKIIENTKYTDCLKIKKRCHIHFDHMQGYYGVSSLESLSQGRPVIAGLDDFNIRCIKQFTGDCELPWVIAKESDSLKSKIRELVFDNGMRKAAGCQARTFMTEKWNEPNVLNALFDAIGADPEFISKRGTVDIPLVLRENVDIDLEQNWLLQ